MQWVSVRGHYGKEWDGYLNSTTRASWEAARRSMRR